jgi:hypothetical protein
MVRSSNADRGAGQCATLFVLSSRLFLYDRVNIPDILSPAPGAFGNRYFEKRAVIYFKLDPPRDANVPAARVNFEDNDVVKSIELYEVA